MYKPSLFGITNSNKDFTKKSTWGKNIFNNAFPTALACYMHSKNLKLVYFTLDNELALQKEYISVIDLFGINPLSDNIYYSFEDKYLQYERFSAKFFPRIDLVTKDLSRSNQCLKPIEIKLTTLPDHTTCELSDEMYGSEIVVRPDTIVYQAFSIALSFESKREELLQILSPIYEQIDDWHNEKKVIKILNKLIESLNLIVRNYNVFQKPLLMQPIWKTEGKSPVLAENCLDIFVWSDFSFMKLFMRNNSGIGNKIDRNNRTIIWLFLMLYQFASEGHIDHNHIIDTYTYKTKNDKAFAISGILTNNIMTCDELTKPRIKKFEIKNIILGNGHEYLSPERRLDGAIQYDASLFK